jgi:hypothetical protein
MENEEKNCVPFRHAVRATSPNLGEEQKKTTNIE